MKVPKAQILAKNVTKEHENDRISHFFVFFTMFGKSSMQRAVQTQNQFASGTNNISFSNYYGGKMKFKSQIDVVGTIESDFHHRYTRLNTENVSDEAEYDAKAEGFASNLISSYAEMYDEIKKGYEEETREIYIPDADAGFGYRKATEQ